MTEGPSAISESRYQAGLHPAQSAREAVSGGPVEPPASAPTGHLSDARAALARSRARSRRFREQQQLVRLARGLLDVTVPRLGHGAALKAPREHLDCLGERRQLVLKPADSLGKLCSAVSGRR
jgi:hypothetical protein